MYLLKLMQSLHQYSNFTDIGDGPGVMDRTHASHSEDLWSNPNLLIFSSYCNRVDLNHLVLISSGINTMTSVEYLFTEHLQILKMEFFQVFSKYTPKYLLFWIPQKSMQIIFLENHFWIHSWRTYWKIFWSFF